VTALGVRLMHDNGEDAGPVPPAIPSVRDIPDEKLLERAVHTARHRGYRKGTKHPRWAAVADAFALGSTYAAQLCRRFGLDPEEMVKR
jgi:hypothetical protein